MGSYAIVQTAGGDLIRVAPDGTQLTLPLPAGVTVSTYRRVRGAILNRRAVLVNGVSRNVQLDPNLIPRILTPKPPTAALSAAIGAAGNLTGGYVYRYTFAITEGERVIAESEFSPASTQVNPTSDQVSLTSIAASSDTSVNARRIYRTAAGPGDSYFLVAQLSNNSTTTYTDNLTDEEIEVFPAEDLGSPPGMNEQDRMEVICAWRDRLWGAGALYPDRLYFSENRLQYAWPNYVVVQPEGEDLSGITGLAARRDELMIGRRRALWSIVGDTPSRFQAIRRVEGVGVWAADSMVVIRDVLYFLAEDGVYTWGSEGLTHISDQGNVGSWFAEDSTVFNPAYFADAIGCYNKQEDTYDLYLPAAGSAVLNRWVSYDIKRRCWYGPHVTAAFTSIGAVANLEGSDDRIDPYIGASDGALYRMNRATRTDGASTAITARATTSPMHHNRADDTKVWGRLTVHTKEETAGTLTIKRRVGDLDAPYSAQAVTSITRAGAVATVTMAAAHGFGTGEDITIAGAAQAEYNGTVNITVTGATTFTYAVSGTPVSPATGTITATHPQRADFSHALTRDRGVLGRVGVGRYAQLVFENAEVGQNVEVRSIEIDPINIKGRR